MISWGVSSRIPLALPLLLLACPPPNAAGGLPYHMTGGEGGSGSGFDDAGSSTGSSTGGSSTGDSGGMSTTDDTTGAGTTAPAPVCGDGVLEDPEECDDGDQNPENGCNNECFRDRYVFTTSETWQPKLNGIMGALGLCRQAAAKAKLPRDWTYNPWLSDSQTDAIDLQHRGRGRYLTLDGTVVANNFDELIAGPLLAPLGVTEYGVPMNGGQMLTGTRPDGTAVPDSTHCNDWFGAGPFEFELWYGHSGAIDSTWTLETDPQVAPTACSGEFRLYCFEGK